MNYSDLYNLDVAPIRQAAERALTSGRVVDKSADYVRDHNMALGKVWRGVDQVAAARSLGQKAVNLENTGQVLRKVNKVLAGLATRLDDLHKRFKEDVDSVNSEGDIRIDPGAGTIKALKPSVTQADIDRVKASLDGYVKNAAEVDSQASDTLRGIDRPSEAANAYQDQSGNAWDADTEDAQRAVDLLKIAKERKLTSDQKAELELLLSQNNTDAEFAGGKKGTHGFLDNPYFGTTKAEQAKNILSAYAKLAEDGDLSKGIQRNLGNVLATGTAADAGEWGRRFSEASEEQFHIGDQRNVPGRLLLAPLLEFGRYDTGFLTPVAANIFTMGQANPQFGDRIPNLNPAGTGENHIDSTVIALANNPATAAKVIGGDPARLRSLIERMKNNKGKDEDLTTEASTTADNFRKLLKAATLGTDADDAYDVRRPHTKDGAAAVRSLITVVGENGEFLDKTGGKVGILEPFRGDITHIAKEYLPDILRNLGSSTKNKAHYATNGATFDIDGGDIPKLHSFIESLGRDKKTYAEFIGASHGALRANLGALKPGEDNKSTIITELALANIRFRAILDDGIREGIITEQVKLDEQSNQFGEWLIAGFQQGLGLATGGIQGKAASAAVEFATGIGTDQLKKLIKVDNLAKAREETATWSAENKRDVTDANRTTIEQFLRFAKKHGIKVDDNLPDGIDSRSYDGYDSQYNSANLRDPVD